MRNLIPIPGNPGSHPEAKVDAHPLSHAGARETKLLIKSLVIKDAIKTNYQVHLAFPSIRVPHLAGSQLCPTMGAFPFRGSWVSHCPVYSSWPLSQSARFVYYLSLPLDSRRPVTLTAKGHNQAVHGANPHFFCLPCMVFSKISIYWQYSKIKSFYIKIRMSKLSGKKI